MPERHLFLVATVMVPAILSLAQAQCGLVGVVLCGGLSAWLLYTLWRQPQKLRQAVTEQTQALRQAQAALQQQLATQTDALTTLRRTQETAAQAQRAKNILLVHVSHELRMPLNAIIGYSEILQEEAAELAGQRFIADLGQIHTASLHLRTLMNDLLDLAKIEAGTMELCLETFDVCDVIQELLAALQPLVQQHDDTLEVTIAPQLGTIYADRAKLRQSLDNLLHYAVTFTHQGTITLHATRETVADRDWIVVSIRDTGLGIGEAQIEGLLHDVVHSQASTVRQFGGIGLGLALSQRLCRLMGGDITLTSAVNAGSLGTLRVPAQTVLPPTTVTTLPLSACLEGGPRDTPDLTRTLAGDTGDRAVLIQDEEGRTCTPNRARFS
jgi:signal transduction histidine kinase